MPPHQTVNIPKLVERMHELGLTPADLAEKAGVSKSTLSLLINGKRTGMNSGTLSLIARVLQVDASALLIDPSVDAQPYIKPDQSVEEQIGDEIVDLLKRDPELAAGFSAIPSDTRSETILLLMRATIRAQGTLKRADIVEDPPAETGLKRRPPKRKPRG